MIKKKLLAVLLSLSILGTSAGFTAYAENNDEVWEVTEEYLADVPEMLEEEEETEPADSYDEGISSEAEEDAAAEGDVEIIYDDSEEAYEETIDEEEDAGIELMATTYTYDIFKYTVSSNKVTITGCDSSVTSVTVPSQIDGMDVTAIGNNAFSGCGKLTELIIPESVTKLGYYMIKGTAITSITIPKSVTSTGHTSYNGPLAGCSTLEKVVFEEGTESVPAYICANSSQTSYITNIVLPSSVRLIDEYAFYKNTRLHDILLPSEITAINRYAFYNCTGLGNVTLPGELITIGYAVFSGCTSMTEVNIPNKVTSVGNSAFASSGLTKVTLNYNDTVNYKCSIGDSTFSGCSNLSEVNLASTVTSIGDYAFKDCVKLNSLILPEGVTSLGYYIIQGTPISSITIPSSVEKSAAYGSGVKNNGALAGATRLTEVIFAEGTEAIPAYICANGSQTSYITNIVLPSSVKSIGNYAFCANTNLHDVSLPNQITAINNYAFCNCTGLGSITLPSELITIGTSVFSGCSSIKEVNIPQKVTSVGNSAFASSGLTKVTFNYNDTVNYKCSIGDSAFSGCSNLSEVNLASTVTSIGDYAFKNCVKLNTLILPEGVTGLGYYIIQGTPISSITIPASLKSSARTVSGTIYNGALAGATRLTEVIFANGIETIPAYICANSSQTSYITKIVLPDSVKAIDDYAFYTNTNLQNISLPNGITAINKGAFCKCAGLSNVELPNELIMIDTSAFSGCTSMTEVNIPNRVTTVGNSAFSSSGLIKVTFNYNNTVNYNCSIGTSAFAGCSNLSEVNLTSTVTSIGNYAFNNCVHLNNLTLPNGLKSVGRFMIQGTAIESLTIPSTVKTLYSLTSNTQNGMLAGATRLTAVTFEDGLESIPAYLCASKSLTSYIEKVYIPASVTSIGNYAFYQCTNMTIYCEENSYAQQYAIDNNIPYVIGKFGGGSERRTVSDNNESGNVSRKYSYSIDQDQKKLNLNTDAVIDGYIKIDTLNISNGAKLTVTSKSKLECDNLTMTGGRLEIDGTVAVNKNMTVKGGKAHAFSSDEEGGIVEVNDTLTVGGLLKVTKCGRIESRYEDSYIEVNDFEISSSSQTVSLQSVFKGGQLRIKGSFKQSGNEKSFCAQGDHAAIFVSGGKHTISFKKPGKSYFCNLYVDEDDRNFPNSSITSDMFTGSFKNVRLTSGGEYEIVSDRESDVITDESSYSEGLIDAYARAAETASASSYYIKGLDDDELELIAAIAGVWYTSTNLTFFNSVTGYGTDESGYSVKMKLKGTGDNKYHDVIFNSSIAHSDWARLGQVNVTIPDLNVRNELLLVSSSTNYQVFCGEVAKYINSECMPQFAKFLGVKTSFVQKQGIALGNKFLDLMMKLLVCHNSRYSIKWNNGILNTPDKVIKSYKLLIDASEYFDTKIMSAGNSYLSAAIERYDAADTVELYSDNDSEYRISNEEMSVDPVNVIQTSEVTDEFEYDLFQTRPIEDILDSAVNQFIETVLGTFNDEELISALKEELAQSDDEELDESRLGEITELDLSDCGIVNINGLNKLTNLQKLTAAGNSIYDLSPITGLTKLTYLDLQDNNIDTITALSGLTKLTTLNLSDNKIENIDALSGLTSLSELYLSNNEIGEFSAINSLTKLQKLDISSNDLYDGDISGITSLSNVIELDASSCGIDNLGSMDLSSCTVLNLAHNNIESLDSVNMRVLKDADVSNNYLEDAAAFAQSANLERLNLSGNYISDISSISGLKKLVHLILSGNELEYTESLSKLTSLRILELNNCSLSSDIIDVITQLSNLQKVDLGNNGLSGVDTEVFGDIEVILTDDTVPVKELWMYMPSDTLTVGETMYVQVHVYPVGAVCNDLKWSSGDAGVASVDNMGKITAIKEGETVIKAYSPSADYAVERWITVTNTDIPAETSVPTETPMADVVDSGKCGDNVAWVLDKNGNLIISGTGEMDDYSNNTNVPWYKYEKNIKFVNITEGVTTIGKNAFSGCGSMVSINIPYGVNKIGDYALYRCFALGSLEIPESVSVIGNRAFSQCTSITNLKIPKSVTSNTVRYTYAYQGIAIRKRIPTNRSNAVRYAYAF